MRPRVFPAEDGRVQEVNLPKLTVASMRPRVFPAEDMRDTNGVEFELMLQ